MVADEAQTSARRCPGLTRWSAKASRIAADDLRCGAKPQICTKVRYRRPEYRPRCLRAAAEVPVRTLRRRVNGTVAEHAILLMMAVGRKLLETDGALDFDFASGAGIRAGEIPS
jgi:hypothetical protein